MSGTYYLGVDPGQVGGLALLRSDGAIIAEPMPSSPLQLIELVRHYKAESGGNIKVVVEQVSSRPGQNCSAVFKFGQGYGSIQMALTAEAISFELKVPKVWQKTFGVSRKPKETVHQWKKRLLALAEQLFPTCAAWKLPTLAARLPMGDAVLIAEYARRKDTGKL